MPPRQQVEDFNPYKAIQPTQQLTDNYIEPGYFQVPQNEWIDIARSLSGLSQTLSTVGQEALKAQVEGEIQSGTAQVDLMTDEELDAALSLKWREAGLPEGASPIAQKAILSHAGAKKARQALEQFRTGNLDRFADPYSNEDPRAAMQQAFEGLGITGHYAGNAAAAEFSKQANAFSEQVYQARAARTAKQNEDDYRDSLYDVLSNRPKPINGEPVTPSQTAEWLEEIEKINSKYHALTGKSGRDGMWASVKAAAMQIAENEGDSQAIKFLSEVGDMTIGGQKLSYSFAAEEDRLIDTVQDIAERSEERDYKNQERARRRLFQIASDAASRIYTQKSLAGGEYYNPSSPESIDEIRQTLVDMGVKEEEVDSVVGEVVKEIDSYQNAGDKDDPEAIASVYTMITGTASLEDTLNHIRGLREDGDLSALMSVKLEGQANDAKDMDDRMAAAERRDRGFRRAEHNLISELRSDDVGLPSDLQTKLYDEYLDRYQEIVRDVVTDPNNAGLDNNRLGSLISTRRQELDSEYLDTIKQLSEKPEKMVIDEGTTDAKRAAIIERRIEDQGSRTRPEQLSAINQEGWDSEFTNVQEDFQQARKDGDQKEEERLRGKLYDLAKKRAGEVPITRTTELPSYRGFKTNTVEVPPSAKDVRDYTRAKAITWFSLQEIKDKKLEGGFDIPDELLDPKFVILFDGIESAEAFEALKTTEEGQRRINEVYDALPPNFQTGDDFFHLQLALFKRYR